VRATLLMAVLPTIVAVAGCSSTPNWDPADFFIAARYDLGDSQSARTAWERGVGVQYDFGRLADLGFDTILVKPASNADAKTALDAAAAQRMDVALSLQVEGEPGMTGRTGKSGNGYQYTPVPLSLVRHKALRAAIVEAGCNSKGASRAVDVCSSVFKAGLRCIPLFEAAHLADSGKRARCKNAREIVASAPAVVDTAMLAVKQHGSPKQQLLAQYHAALSAEQTGGLVVSGWQHEDTAENGRFDSLPAPRAAMTALIERAKRWGPRLVGSTVVRTEASVSCAPCFRVTVFARGNRHHILVFNPAPDHYAGGKLRIPARFDGKKIQKAVQIPGDNAPTPGKVHKAAHGTIIVPLKLSPGDAALFEVF